MLTGMSFGLNIELVGLISEAETSIRSLNDVALPALAPLARLLLRTESIASSKVEGMQIGIRELARAEARVEVGRKPSATALEILANIDAMELAVHDATAVDVFSINEITAIHRRLMEHAPNSRIAGKIRTEQNWIGGNNYNPCGADFVPPPPTYIATLLEDLGEAINSHDLPPLVQAALVHAQFETIHPFDDGNGRTGRALIQVVLRRRGIAPLYVPPMSVVLASAREQYIDGLMRFRDNDKDGVSDWIEHFVIAAARSASLANSYLIAVRALMDRWKVMLASHKYAPRAGAAAWAIIDVLPAHPIITAPIAVLATGRSNPSVYEGIKQLVGAGVLVPQSHAVRGQMWEATGLLELLARMEDGQDLRCPPL